MKIGMFLQRWFQRGAGGETVGWKIY